uniref:Proteasome endopeptidase complex n=1 Tax=Medicago truncatula TaxID=3880 RepID=I3SNG7_MEDTR|nr:unknown [Medicago truncatula]
MTKQHANWSPYDNNGGSCVAIAGSDYCVIAADTRMSTGYNILTRDYSKISHLAEKCVMAPSGFQADVKALQKVLSARHLTYQHQHNKQMSCPAMAQLLSNTLYYKRFFPYYSSMCWVALTVKERDASSLMMLLVPMRGWDIVLRVLAPLSLCRFLITN